MMILASSTFWNRKSSAQLALLITPVGEEGNNQSHHESPVPVYKHTYMISWYALAQVFHRKFRRFGDYTATFISEWLNTTLRLYK